MQILYFRVRIDAQKKAREPKAAVPQIHYFPDAADDYDESDPDDDLDI